jgi:hypothetical protein
MTRHKLLDLVRRLPEEKLSEAEELLSRLVESSFPIEPVSLKGIWAGAVITEADIAEARRYMWGRFGERAE